jgi:hypothetical protein
MKTPNVPIWGNEVSDYYVNNSDETTGTVAYFGNNGDPPSNTGSNGVLVVNNALAPAYWDVNWLEPWPCGYNTDPQQPGPVYQGTTTYSGQPWWVYQTPNGLIQNYYATKQGFSLDCILYGALQAASTRFAILGSFPSTITLGGATSFTTNSGMPLLYVYDEVAI